MYTNDDAVKKIGKACFPDYNGKKFQVKQWDGRALSLNNNHWDGGSRIYYVFYSLTSGAIMPSPEAGTPFTGTVDCVLLPVDCVLVSHSIFCGKDVGITVLVHPENWVKMLPHETKQPLSPYEEVVLYYTRSLKPCYGGVSNYRFVRARKEKGITAEQWEEAKASLVARGLLMKNGGLSVDGKNACESIKMNRW